MPSRKTTTPNREPCPACDWFSRWLDRLGFKAGDQIRVVEAERLVVIVAGDHGVASNESRPWPSVLAAAVNSPKKERR